MLCCEYGNCISWCFFRGEHIWNHTIFQVYKMKPKQFFFFLSESHYWHVRGGLVFSQWSSTSPSHTPIIYTLAHFDAILLLEELSCHLKHCLCLYFLTCKYETLSQSNSRHSASRLERETDIYWQTGGPSSIRCFRREGGFICCQTLQSGPGVPSRPLKPGTTCLPASVSKLLKQQRKRVKRLLFVAACPFLPWKKQGNSDWWKVISSWTLNSNSNTCFLTWILMFMLVIS